MNRTSKIKLYKIEDIVYDILKECPKARSNDNYLMLKVVEVINPMLLHVSYETALLQEKPVVSFKTVERCRRKVQQKWPELKATDKVQEARSEYQNIFTEYAIEDQHIPRID